MGELDSKYSHIVYEWLCMVMYGYMRLYMVICGYILHAVICLVMTTY